MRRHMYLFTGNVMYYNMKGNKEDPRYWLSTIEHLEPKSWHGQPSDLPNASLGRY